MALEWRREVYQWLFWEFTHQNRLCLPTHGFTNFVCVRFGRKINLFLWLQWKGREVFSRKWCYEMFISGLALSVCLFVFQRPWANFKPSSRRLSIPRDSCVEKFHPASQPKCKRTEIKGVCCEIEWHTDPSPYQEIALVSAICIKMIYPIFGVYNDKPSGSGGPAVISLK